MALEIERKFLVVGEPWLDLHCQAVRIQQAYFARTPLVRARVRLLNDKGFLSLKSSNDGLARHEFEYEIPKLDAVEIMKQFNVEPVITKTRHSLTHAGVQWVIDQFEGANSGLIIAEVELDSEHQQVQLPAWIGKEVTGDRRFGNSSLARYPFVAWKTDEIFKGS